MTTRTYQVLAVAFIAAVLLLLVPSLARAQVLHPSRGGTGTSSIPTYGKVLVGNANGTYTLMATSSLGFPGLGGSGITVFNGLNTDPQVLATSSSNGGWGFSSSGSTHTLNIPTASASNPLGLLSSADWTTFNAKEAVLSFVYPLVRSANSVSLAFGTTTSNTWASTQTFGHVNLTGNLTFNGVTGSTWAAFCTTITGSADLCDGSDATGGGGGAGTVTQINTTYPLQGGPITDTGTLSLAFGTTTANTWGAHNIFSSLFATSASTTNATTSNLSITSLTSALLQTDGSGILAEYGGTSCTNQFVRSLSALGVATCATVANTDLANSTVSYGGVQLSLGGTDATPAFNLVDATGLPISTGVSGLGSGIATWLATPSSANLATALTDETGSGSAVFSAAPTFTGVANFADLITTNATATNATTTNLYASGQTRIASLSGILKATSGVVSAAVAGVDYLTSAITAIGPTGQTSDGPTVTFATSTSAFNGLTSALTIVGSGDTLTFTPSLSGTLDNAGLTNSSVSFGGVSLSLGGSDATPAFDLTDATSLPIVGGTTGTLTVARGGTGQTTFTSSQLLYGNGTNALSSVATTSASCSGSVSCSAFTVIGASPITISGTDTVGITAIGPVGQTADGPTVTFATSTDTNVGLTITGSGDTMTFTSTWAGTLADARVADTLTIGAGSTVADGALSANVSLLGSTIGATELASADFGSFTCNGTICTVDAGAISNAMLANSTISGIALGSNLADLTATDSTLTFSGTYNGSTARTIGLNLGNANIWTGHQRFTNASSTLFSNVGTAYFGGTATTTINSAGSVALPTGATLTVTDMTSALLLTNGSGVVAEYAGTSCTNQVTTALSALGVATCSSINNAYWSGTDLSVANGGTGLSTFGGTNTILYTTAADTLSSEAAFLYDPSANRITLDYATTTAISGTNFNFSGIGVMARAVISGIAAAFTPAVEGEIGIDTTDNQFKYYSGGATRVLAPEISSTVNLGTTTMGTGTTTKSFAGFTHGTTFTKFGCRAAGGGTFVAVLGDGTASTTAVVSATGLTTTFTTLSSNNTFTAGEVFFLAYGSVSGTVNDPSCGYGRTITGT